jgi:hypothetical protein
VNNILKYIYNLTFDDERIVRKEAGTIPTFPNE